MIINLNTGENVKKITFPDKQPHLNAGKILLETDHPNFDVVCSLTDSDKFLELAMINNILRGDGRKIRTLHIPYLMGARYDRVMIPGDSLDIKVIADIINRIGANRVVLYDPHSDVAPALIDRSIVVTNQKLVEAYDKQNAVLIIPDAGAAKKAFEYSKWNKNITSYVQALKHRDVNTGKIIDTEILRANTCHHRHCVIIDDICDGGRTFVEIAKTLYNEGIRVDSLTLIVTHGIFSAGFDQLDYYFDEIITSNSLFKEYNSNKLKVVEYDFQ